jgi:hypothetical protein
VIRALALALALLAGGTAIAARPAHPGGDGPRLRALAFARRHLGRRWANDCSGFVLAAFREAGLRPRLGRGRSRSESLHRASRPVQSPRPGHLAFFHHTYDRNRDGRANDPYSHVALVEAVDGDAVTLLHRGSRGIERVRMNLRRPSDPAANDPVRARRRRDPRKLRVLAGELFAGYGALPGT